MECFWADLSDKGQNDPMYIYIIFDSLQKIYVRSRPKWTILLLYTNDNRTGISILDLYQKELSHILIKIQNLIDIQASHGRIQIL
jgi:hypothetical protein